MLNFLLFLLNPALTQNFSGSLSCIFDVSKLSRFIDSHSKLFVSNNKNKKIHNEHATQIMKETYNVAR